MSCSRSCSRSRPRPVRSRPSRRGCCRPLPRRRRRGRCSTRRSRRRRLPPRHRATAEREDAVTAAVRALRFRDRSRVELDRWLRERGVGDEERAETLATLARLGYLDDARVARLRAEQLAGRGSGDALIRHDLRGRGLDSEHVEAALEALPPERERAARVTAERGPGARTVRYLAARGFGEDALQAVVVHEE